ncbi:MAG: hypothetical protein V7L23_19010 [Nostoc sp.]
MSIGGETGKSSSLPFIRGGLGWGKRIFDTSNTRNLFYIFIQKLSAIAPLNPIANAIINCMLFTNYELRITN